MEIRKHTERLKNWLEYKKYAKTTIGHYCDNLERFLKSFDGEYPEPKQIPSRKIVEFMSRFDEVNTHKAYLAPIKIFYEKILHQTDKFKGIEYPRKKEHFIDLPTVEEVSLLIKACDNTKHRCIIKTFVACGLRISELLSIKLDDIDEYLGILKVFGKGGKWRNVKIPDSLIEELNIYKSQFSPVVYLFEGQSGGQYTETSIRQFLIKYARKAGIKVHIHPHVLRHFYGTYSLEMGVQQRVLQSMMGHNSPKTLQIYTHIRKESVAMQRTPLELV